MRKIARDVFDIIPMPVVLFSACGMLSYCYFWVFLISLGINHTWQLKLVGVLCIGFIAFLTWPRLCRPDTTQNHWPPELFAWILAPLLSGVMLYPGVLFTAIIADIESSGNQTKFFGPIAYLLITAPGILMCVVMALRSVPVMFSILRIIVSVCIPSAAMAFMILA